MIAPAKAYIVIELDVFDPAIFQQYRAEVEPIIVSYGGRYLARGGETQSIEGEAPLPRVILLEFPDLAAANAFMHSDEYQPVGALRHKSAQSRIYIVEGYNP